MPTDRIRNTRSLATKQLHIDPAKAERVKIDLPQNPYNEIGITGHDLSVAFYEALRLVMKLNPHAQFMAPDKSITREKWAESHGGDDSGVDWALINKSVGRPW